MRYDKGMSDPTLIDGTAGSNADIPDRIGPYRVVRLLGRGGMGSVYLATRDDDQFKRRVAVKVIRKGMDTDDVLKRFAVERQILTALNHPGIARVFDAGEMSDGRPYVVMEYIEGLPIDVYCDKQRLNTEDRLRLFMKVCAAVHLAHQHQIVHRDLKPSNVLVTPDGEPKLLDFGIAKLLNPDLAAVTLVTGPELRVMTPEYASPEQASGDPITTASDVYSLGVMLYELLTGKRPYSFKTRVRDEVIRVVQEVEPATPSTAITQAEQITNENGETRTLTPEELARTRESTVDRLRKRLRGDLDNIVMMALQKTTKRRYPSASELSADIQRHLQGYPVLARPDSVSYSLSRLVRRHRVQFLLSGAVSLSLLLGLALAAWQAGRVRQRDQQLQQVRVFAGDFVQSLSQSLARTEGSLPARKTLIDSSTQILEYMATSFPEDEQLQRLRAKALRQLADAQGGRGQNLGQRENAERNYRAALALLDEQHRRRPNDFDVIIDMAGTRTSLATLALRQRNTEEAASLLDETITILDGTTWPPQIAPRAQRERSQALLARARLRDQSGDDKGATQDLLDSLDIRKKLLAQEPANLEYIRDVTVAFTRLGERAEWSDPPQLEVALGYYSEALERRKAINAIVANATSKRDVTVARKFVGDTLSQLGRMDEARVELLGALEALKALADANELDARSRWDIVELEYSLALNELSAEKHAQAGVHLRHAFEAAVEFDAEESVTSERRTFVNVASMYAEWQCKGDQGEGVLQTYERAIAWLSRASDVEDLVAAIRLAQSESSCVEAR